MCTYTHNHMTNEDIRWAKILKITNTLRNVIWSGGALDEDRLLNEIELEYHVTRRKAQEYLRVAKSQVQPRKVEEEKV